MVFTPLIGLFHEERQLQSKRNCWFQFFFILIKHKYPHINVAMLLAHQSLVETRWRQVHLGKLVKVACNQKIPSQNEGILDAFHPLIERQVVFDAIWKRREMRECLLNLFSLWCFSVDDALLRWCLIMEAQHQSIGSHHVMSIDEKRSYSFSNGAAVCAASVHAPIRSQSKRVHGIALSFVLIKGHSEIACVNLGKGSETTSMFRH
mmetsp:Transcript_10698/g.40019  ORF Transcript_10698/g.40019 Transcript_10698/m.40019 type:complete len:206 (-) Transcript_10698:2219-2836(-)